MALFLSGSAADFGDWCGERAIEIGYIQPGKPDQNAYIERFNRSYRGDGAVDVRDRGVPKSVEVVGPLAYTPLAYIRIIEPRMADGFGLVRFPLSSPQ